MYSAVQRMMELMHLTQHITQHITQLVTQAYLSLITQHITQHIIQHASSKYTDLRMSSPSKVPVRQLLEQPIVCLLL